jgi:hypothetical protein
MAFAMKCDICGELYEMYECKALKYTNGISFIYNDLDKYSNRLEYDCCPDCLNEISKTIKARKKMKEV